MKEGDDLITRPFAGRDPPKMKGTQFSDRGRRPRLQLSLGKCERDAGISQVSLMEPLSGVNYLQHSQMGSQRKSSMTPH